MTNAQITARNEAYQLIAIAERMLKDAGLVAYADDAARIKASMEMDAKMLRDQAAGKNAA